MKPPPPQVQARAHKLLEAFRATDMPSAEVVQALLDEILKRRPLRGVPEELQDKGLLPSTKDVLMELWLTALAASGTAAMLARELEKHTSHEHVDELCASTDPVVRAMLS